MCENEQINGVTRDGGYAEYVLLRTEAVVRVPTDVDPVEYAPILCAGKSAHKRTVDRLTKSIQASQSSTVFAS